MQPFDASVDQTNVASLQEIYITSTIAMNRVL
jgi:hypothetical protein